MRGRPIHDEGSDLDRARRAAPAAVRGGARVSRIGGGGARHEALRPAAHGSAAARRARLATRPVRALRHPPLRSILYRGCSARCSRGGSPRASCGLVYRGAVALEINCAEIGGGCAPPRLRDDHHRAAHRRGLSVRAAGDRRLRRPRRLRRRSGTACGSARGDRARADHDRRRRGDRGGCGGRQGRARRGRSSAACRAKAIEHARRPLRRPGASGAQRQQSAVA